MAAVAAVEVVLPLHDHTEVLVVEDNGLGGDLLDVGGGEFLNVHQEGTIAIDVDDLFVGATDLGTDGGGESVAHGTEAGGGDELAGMPVFVPLTGPHLVLADAGGDDGVALGEFVKFLDDHLGEDELLTILDVGLDVVGIDDLGLGGVLEGGFGLPLGDLGMPGVVAALDATASFDELVEAGEGVLEIAVDAEVGALVLVVFGTVEVDVDDGGFLGELAEGAGDAVIEADTAGEEEIGAGLEFDEGFGGGEALDELAVDGPVGEGGAVHAEPAEGERVFLGETADAHEGGGDGDVAGFGKLQEFLGGAGGDDAAADVEDGTFGLFDEADDLIEFEVAGGDVFGVAAETGLDFVEGGPDGLGLLLLDVLGEVEDDGAGSSGFGDVEGFGDDAGDVVDVGDEVGMLHDRHGDADHVGFLEGAAPDHGLGDLAGDGDQGAGIHEGIGDGGDEVGGPGAGGGHADAGLAGDACVAFGGEGATLFMAGQDGADLRLGEGLMEFHRGAAGIGEDDFDTGPFEGLDKDVASEHQGADLALGIGRGGCSGSTHGV